MIFFVWPEIITKKQINFCAWLKNTPHEILLAIFELLRGAVRCFR